MPIRFDSDRAKASFSFPAGNSNSNLQQTPLCLNIAIVLILYSRSVQSLIRMAPFGEQEKPRAFALHSDIDPYFLTTIPYPKVSFSLCRFYPDTRSSLWLRSDPMIAWLFRYPGTKIRTHARLATVFHVIRERRKCFGRTGMPSPLLSLRCPSTSPLKSLGDCSTHTADG
jgi:hypothetical protein